jgi:hypothetical protein
LRHERREGSLLSTEVAAVFTNDSGHSLCMDRMHSEQYSRNPGRHGSASMWCQDSHPPREGRCGGSMQQGVEHVEATCRPVAHAPARQQCVEAEGENGKRAKRAMGATVLERGAPEIAAQEVQQWGLRQHVFVGENGATATEFNRSVARL